MNFITFYKQFKDFTVFSVNDIEKAYPHFDRKILVAWQRKGYLIKIRNRWYCFAESPIREDDLRLIANKIYSPSYISLESALAYYQFIPEGVFRITSISTLKTIHFDTPIGYFDYRNIKKNLFWGYRLIKQTTRTMPGWYKMATAEKAVIDFLYLNPQYQDVADFESLRFNWQSFEEKVHIEQLENYLKQINSSALTNRMQTLLNLFYAQS